MLLRDKCNSAPEQVYPSLCTRMCECECVSALSQLLSRSHSLCMTRSLACLFSLCTCFVLVTRTHTIKECGL